MPEAQNSDQESSLEGTSRRFLTFFVVSISVLGVLALGVVSIIIPSGTTANVDRFDRIKFVMATILPVLASWVGTIMAFYFSKENFLAATQSVTELTKSITGAEKLKSISVADTMRSRDKITFEQIPPGQESATKLGDLETKYSSLERILIMDQNFVMRYLIYKSMIDRYLSGVATGAVTLPQGTKSTELTLKDLLSWDPQTKTMFEKSFGFVGSNATLADAKLVMDNIEKCGDVFVTQTGKANEPVLGWVTDNAIAENSKV